MSSWTTHQPQYEAFGASLTRVITPSKQLVDLITKACELVAWGRSQYPLPQESSSIKHSERLNTTIVQLEEIFREKNTT